VAKKQTKLNQAGFSVIEVLITLFIIGVTLILYQTASRSIILNRYGRYREVALRIADQKIQTLRTTPFASLPSSGPFSDPQLGIIPQGTGTVTLTDENSRLKRVTVLVTWRNPQGTGIDRVQLDTYITQGGLGQ
jgi:prepilin-type N-terminal cleavage/methylation domain-containing protein